MWSGRGPEAGEMGKFEARPRLTAVRRLCGHDLIGPSGVLLQSMVRTSLPISPPPASQSFTRVLCPGPPSFARIAVISCSIPFGTTRAAPHALPVCTWSYIPNVSPTQGPSSKQVAAHGARSYTHDGEAKGSGWACPGNKKAALVGAAGDQESKDIRRWRGARPRAWRR